MNQQKLNYIHYYLLAIITSILVWGGFEYIAICNGHNCKVDTSRLWKGLSLIALIFIPITLCIWSEYVNGQLKKVFGSIKLLYEEKILIFAFAIFISLGIVSLMVFNLWWDHFVKTPSPKEYMAAIVNLSVFVATIFAPFAAIMLYDNWKIQHNKAVISDDAKEVWNLLVALSIETLDLDHDYYNLQGSDYLYFNENKKILDKIENIKKNTEHAMVRFHYFNELSGSKDASSLYLEFYGIYKDYKTYLEKVGDSKTISDVEEVEKDFRERLYEANEDIRLHLRQFILA